MRFRDLTFDANGPALVMGILNVTPDSFYDGGRYDAVDRARARAADLVRDGAAIVDVGGRSYSSAVAAVDERLERGRVVPVVRALVRDGLDAAISVDTTHASVADAALAEGAHLINDCSGLSDPHLPGVVASYGAALVVMHLRGRLNVRDERYAYDDPVAEIGAYLLERVARAREAGIAGDAIAVDPGLEFGKELPTDLTLLARMSAFAALGYPVLLAVSRKSFLGAVVRRPAAELLAASLAAAALGIAAGARIVRAHDVAETRDVAAVCAAVEAHNQARAARVEG